MPSNDPIAQRIREAVLKLQTNTERVSLPPDRKHENAQQAIRMLARSRVSNILRQLRAASGLSYDELHEQTGISKQLLFDLEYKDHRLTLEELRRLVDCYGVSVNDVLGVDID
ncbi:MAG: helix-turn-helix transcriptional regulator [Caldilineaceae bacterium]